MPIAPRFRRSFSLVSALTIGWSSIALAAPAIVQYDTDARSAPFAVAPLVESLPHGLKLEADELATDGWRLVRLPSGKFAYVRDADVIVAPSQPGRPPPHAPTAGPSAAPATSEGSAAASTSPVEPLSLPAPIGRAPIYVADFGHLSELVRTDRQAFELANGLAMRQTAAGVSTVGGVLLGAVLMLLADTALKSKDCIQSVCVESRRVWLNDVAWSLIFVGPVLGWALFPTAADRAVVLDAWNRRHPDRPFVDHTGVEASQ